MIWPYLDTRKSNILRPALIVLLVIVLGMGNFNPFGEAVMRYVLLSALMVLLGVSSVTASYREVFEKEFLFKPWGSEELEVNACVDCHSSDIMKPEFQNITQEWKMSWHNQNNVSCQDCHGGDSKDATMSMSHQRGFIGTPKYTDAGILREVSYWHLKYL
jgi:hypothetical protein